MKHESMMKERKERRYVEMDFLIADIDMVILSMKADKCL